MSAAKPLEFISVEDYLTDERSARHKHEFAGGRVYMMAGARNEHNRIAVAFVSAMYTRLRGKPCEPFNSDAKVRVRFRGDTRFYYPDGMVVCEPNPPGDVFQDRPVVIAEVISPRSRRIDEFEKREAYLSIPSLMSYLMIETTSARVVTCERQTDGAFVQRVYEGMDVVIPLDALRTSLQLAELYERVEFTPDDPEEE